MWRTTGIGFSGPRKEALFAYPKQGKTFCCWGNFTIYGSFLHCCCYLFYKIISETDKYHVHDHQMFSIHIYIYVSIYRVTPRRATMRVFWFESDSIFWAVSVNQRLRETLWFWTLQSCHICSNMTFTLSKLSRLRVDPGFVQETQWQLSKSQALVDVDDEFFPVVTVWWCLQRGCLILRKIYIITPELATNYPFRGGSREMQIYRNVEWFAPNSALLCIVWVGNRQ